MKFLLCWRLAAEGIRKNRKLYIPYLLTCIGMVLMAYILHSLSYTPALLHMPGGSTVQLILSLGKFVIAVFAAMFLLYTNSFLVRRRYREFGLYNILGMDKSTLAQVILWESVIVALLGLGLGLAFGILLSKLAELGLLRFIHRSVDYSFTLSWEGIRMILVLFVPIFSILTLKSLVQVYRTNPLALLHSERVGEKPPKANYLLAIGGLGLLAAAYFMAVTIRNPLAALTMFFVAVILVIAGTYLLCISGSVTLCRFLQGRKRFYYQKNHFISVSTMVYRMKRNGAGLASICILSTMVLVMLTSTSSLYIGAEDGISKRYPNDLGIALHVSGVDAMAKPRQDAVSTTFEAFFDGQNADIAQPQYYAYATIAGLLTDGDVDPDSTNVDTSDFFVLSNLRELFFFCQDDYNRCMGTSLSLQPGQAMVCCLHCTFDRPHLTLGGMSLEIVGILEEFMSIGEANSSAVPVLLIVVPDLETIRPLEALQDTLGRQMLNSRIYYGCDAPGMSDDEIMDLFAAMKQQIPAIDSLNDDNGFAWSSECRAEGRVDFYSLYGALFFLGILLSILFLCAAVLMIYYKQISEGYEDQARFAILRKVGMTRQDIRKSVNAQVLTVFFIPLILAGVHLAFAFPMVWQLLNMLNLRNLQLVIAVNVVVYLIFCLFYAVIYKFTAGAYYGIVSGGKEE